MTCITTPALRMSADLLKTSTFDPCLPIRAPPLLLVLLSLLQLPTSTIVPSYPMCASC